MTILTKNTDKLREEVAAHVAADSIVQGIYWDAENERGCFIGCLGRSKDPTINEVTYGLPVMVQRIAENIFEALPANEAKAFFATLPDAVGCDGKDLTRVGWQFLAAELRSLPEQPAEIQAVIDPVIAGMDKLASGQEWPAELAESARVAAGDAGDAGDAAAWWAAAAAEASGASAVDVVRAAAWAAEASAGASVARAATRAAAASAGAAVRLRQRDLLLRLISDAPVVENPMADTDQVLDLAAIIREVDGNHSKGAAALAESILDHPDFRAALSDEPAVPEGREPAAVTGQPSDEELLELWQGWNLGWDPQKGMVLMPHPAEYARAVLARWGTSNLAETRSSLGGMPTPAPADKGEVEELVVDELVKRLRTKAATEKLNRCHYSAILLARAADLLEQRHPAPVPVSERLPEPEDCDVNGRCWVWWKNGVRWVLDEWTHHELREGQLSDCVSHWLPAHALPIPHQQENAND